MNIAVASNFTGTMRHIAQVFESNTGHQLLLSSGSSGKHYAQIKNGAPFDMFFSADSFRAKQLERDGFVIDHMRFTYAYGRLVLWGKRGQLEQISDQELTSRSLKNLAIANPRLAPYGEAALEVLRSMGLEDSMSNKLVFGENINQAFMFVASENIELGMLSYAQMKSAGLTNYWLIPEKYHAPIEQQAVVLKDSEVARDFFEFMHSRQALNIITKAGFGTIDDY